MHACMHMRVVRYYVYVRTHTTLRTALLHCTVLSGRWRLDRADVQYYYSNCVAGWLYCIYVCPQSKRYVGLYNINGIGIPKEKKSFSRLVSCYFINLAKLGKYVSSYCLLRKERGKSPWPFPPPPLPTRPIVALLFIHSLDRPLPPSSQIFLKVNTNSAAAAATASLLAATLKVTTYYLPWYYDTTTGTG